MKNTYTIITPVRDEIDTIHFTLHAVVNQSILPRRWILLDDGSTDGTREILQEYGKKYHWIQIVHLPYHDARSVGENIVHIIHEGLELIKDIKWDFWVKLDADISFEHNYFEILLSRFEKNPNLGMASGKSFIPSQNGKRFLEWSPNHHVVGMARMYRYACWRDIGSLAPRRLWDVIDVYTAQMNGWETRSFEDIHLIHHRAIDSLQQNQLQRRVDAGINYYTIGYHPLYFLARSIRAIWDERPYILAGLAMYAGFLFAKITQKEIFSQDLKHFIQREQTKNLNLTSLRYYLQQRAKKTE